MGHLAALPRLSSGVVGRNALAGVIVGVIAFPLAIASAFKVGLPPSAAAAFVPVPGGG
jgi:MFS superfamily sulfate permease-like transporter